MKNSVNIMVSELAWMDEHPFRSEERTLDDSLDRKLFWRVFDLFDGWRNISGPYKAMQQRNRIEIGSADAYYRLMASGKQKKTAI